MKGHQYYTLDDADVFEVNTRDGTAGGYLGHRIETKYDYAEDASLLDKLRGTEHLIKPLGGGQAQWVSAIHCFDINGYAEDGSSDYDDSDTADEDDDDTG
jgi:hypothetical protein